MIKNKFKDFIVKDIDLISVFDANTEQLDYELRGANIASFDLAVAAESRDKTDGRGNTIMTFYDAQTGTLTFDHATVSMPLLSHQWGAKMKEATEGDTIIKESRKTFKITEGQESIVLDNVPVGGVVGSEISYIYLYDGNVHTDTYNVGQAVDDKTFTISASTKTISLPTDIPAGNIIVWYKHESTTAREITKTTDSTPEIKKIIARARIMNPCEKTKFYYADIVSYGAQLDPNSSLTFDTDSVQSGTFNFNKDYCSDEETLFKMVIDDE